MLEQSVRPDSQTSLFAFYTSLSSPQYQPGVLPAAQNITTFKCRGLMEKKKHHFLFHFVRNEGRKN